jgi:hypothetical protein
MAIYKQLMPAPYKINLRQLYNDGRDIAVIVNNDDTGYLNRNGSTILAKCRLIIRTEKYSIYRLPLCKLISEESPDLALSSNYIIHNFHLHKGCFVKDTSIFFIYESFDNVSSPILYRGKGAARGTKAVFNLILNLGTEKLDTSKYYDISFWYYNYLWDQTYNTAIISEKSRSGETLQDLTFDPLNADIIDGWWYLSEYRFKIKSNNSMLSFCLHGENNFKPWFVIDEFLLRPSNIDIYNLKSENGKIIVYKNNQRLSDRE